MIGVLAGVTAISVAELLAAFDPRLRNPLFEVGDRVNGAAVLRGTVQVANGSVHIIDTLSFPRAKSIRQSEGHFLPARTRRMVSGPSAFRFLLILRYGLLRRPGCQVLSAL